MKDNNCIFCKLANGDIPTNSIYEDNDFKVILDADPATKGHALILPKNHFANLLEADDSVLEKALPLAKKIANKMKLELKCAGVNIVQNNGEAAGQTVHHLHIHVIQDMRMILIRQFVAGVIKALPKKKQKLW